MMKMGTCRDERLEPGGELRQHAGIMVSRRRCHGAAVRRLSSEEGGACRGGGYRGLPPTWMKNDQPGIGVGVVSSVGATS